MKHKLAGLIDKARKLETSIATSVEGAARSIAGASTRQPIEIVHAIVDEIGKDVEPAGRGLSVFPFNHVRVTFVAASAKQQTRLEVACEGPPTLQWRIEDRLTRLGCRTPQVAVEMTFVPEARPDWVDPEFHLECTRTVMAPATAASPPMEFTLTVTRGTAESAAYVMTGTTIAIGRGQEVRDSRERLIRTNHVAFVEADGEINRSVSRRHARIEREAAGVYRLFDDGSAQGTSVIRAGRSHDVPRGAKGLRLREGDEIVLGQARLRVGAAPGHAPGHVE